MSATTSTTPTSESASADSGDGKLNGRVAFVTGGTRGIGAGICHSLMGQGATVAAGYSRDREKAEAFLAELSKRGGQGSVHQGNVGSADDCRRTIAEVIERYGHLDILVNTHD